MYRNVGSRIDRAVAETLLGAFDELEFDSGSDFLLDDDVDEAKRGRPKLSDALTRQEKSYIRLLANLIANKEAHRRGRRASTRGRHEQGLTKRIRALERSAYRNIDDGRGYEQVIAELERRRDRFDEADEFFDFGCLFSSCAMVRDPDTGLSRCVNRGCSGRCELGSFFGSNNICCCR